MSGKDESVENPHAGNLDENIAVAREMHHTHGADLTRAAQWLSDTTGGAVSVADAIEHIEKKDD
jgi:hypothetical protein